MADDPSKQTQRFHFVRSAGFETRRVDGVRVDETLNGNVVMAFYVVRSDLEGMIEVAVGEDGVIGDTVASEFSEDMVFELQQGIILDADDARNLRDRLNEILDEEPS